MPRIRYFASNTTWGRILIPSQMVSKPDHKFHLTGYFIRPLSVPLSLVAKLIKNPPAGDLRWIHESERFHGEGIGYPLKYSWASLMAQLVKNLPAMWETWVQFLGWEDPLEKGKDAHSSILGLPLCGSAGKESTCNAGDLSSIPELGRSPGEGKGYPLQYSGLENSMDCIGHGLSKSWT